MKKQSPHSFERILGRRVARELPREVLGRTAGQAVGVLTYTLLYPSDPGGPTVDNGGGPIWT